MILVFGVPIHYSRLGTNRKHRVLVLHNIQLEYPMMSYEQEFVATHQGDLLYYL
jgi:hypothetical protein